MRGLICRQTRRSLTQTALKTWEDHVVPSGAVRFNSSTQSYPFPNGSEIVVAGLDKPEKVMSAEYDLIYLQEGTEAKLDAWEALTSRLRNGVMPYQQLIADCNPSAPTHWLKQRADRPHIHGKTCPDVCEQRTVCHMINSRHEDNPVLFDQQTGEMTEFGRVYLGRLDALTGIRLQRLRYGKWVAAEGLVYEGFSTADHVVPSFPVPRDWPHFWVIDFGYTNPFVWQDWVQTPDGALVLIKEIYRTQRLVQDHCKDIIAAVGGVLLKEGQVVWTDAEPKPRRVICDHDAEDRATFERWTGLQTSAAKKAVSPGIQSVAARLVKQPPKDKPRIFFVDDALQEIDTDLMDAAKPYSTIQEFDGYVWDVSNGRKKGEEPVKEDDHGMDCVRYMVYELDSKSKTVPDMKLADMKSPSIWANQSPMYRVFDDADDDERSSSRRSLFKVGGN